MQHEFEHLGYFELHALLVDKNRAFTDGIKAGKKHTELQSIYHSIHKVYTELRTRKLQPMVIVS